MGNLRNGIHLKPLKSDDTETMYNLKSRSTLTGSKFFGAFNCLAFKTQTVNFEKRILRILCTGVVYIT